MKFPTANCQLPIARSRAAFTLVELLCVIAIIGVLASMITPLVGGMLDKADNVRCVSNLRQFSVAIHAYATDHDNRLPLVETDPQNPVYESDAGALPLTEVLRAYQLPPDVFKCPGDLKAHLNFKEGASFYAKNGTSYEWRPLFDDEPITDPKLLLPSRSGNNVKGREIPQSRVRLMVDYVNAGEAPHLRSAEGSSYNSLYLDGSVRSTALRKQ